jgi:hypothetical protein
MTQDRGFKIARRGMLRSAGSLATLPLIGCTAAGQSSVRDAASNRASAVSGSSANSEVNGRRRLGQLEVSSIGMGVQNMSRKYNTLVPYRPEMIDVIRSAFDRGLTFFDAAEAYGPHEVERILGEAIQPFRDQVQVATKFGWNIDLQTGGGVTAVQMNIRCSGVAPKARLSLSARNSA